MTTLYSWRGKTTHCSLNYLLRNRKSSIWWKKESSTPKSTKLFNKRWSHCLQISTCMGYLANKLKVRSNSISWPSKTATMAISTHGSNNLFRAQVYNMKSNPIGIKHWQNRKKTQYLTKSTVKMERWRNSPAMTVPSIFKKYSTWRLYKAAS